MVRTAWMVCCAAICLLLSGNALAQVYEITTTGNQEVFADLVVDLSSPSDAQQTRTTWGGITGYWLADNGCGGPSEELTFTFTPAVSNVEIAITAASSGVPPSAEEIEFEVDGSPYTLLPGELDNTTPAGGAELEISNNRLRAVGTSDDGRGTYTLSGPINSLTIRNIWISTCPNGSVFQVTALNPHICGNGIPQGVEACDDGNGSNNDDCLNDCSAASCGDGHAHTEGSGGETCDDGNGVDGDDCLNSCQIASCGDGVLHDQGSGVEACDDGNDNDSDDCLNDCTAATCGDGYLHDQASGTEQCDDGQNNSDSEADACRSDCQSASCGDGVTDSGETCDDGAGNNDSEADACRSNCALPSCGDGVVDGGELCDDGAANSDSEADACRTTCVAARCGDGVIDTIEQCDDGNMVSLDGCANDCLDESNGQGGSTPIDDGPNGSPVDAGGDGCGCKLRGLRNDAGGATVLLLLLALGAALRRERRAA